MARNLSTNAQVVLTMNGQQANREMKMMEAEAQRLQKELKKAKDAGDSITANKINKSLDEVNSRLNMLRTSTVKVEETLRNLDKATPRELNKALNALKASLNGIERGSEAWNRQVANIRRVQEQINLVNAELRTQNTLWGRFKSWMSEINTMVVGVTAAVTGLVAAGRNAVNAFAEMDEQMANTRKFTGLTKEGCDQLNASMKAMSTRTAREQLNELAQEAGRLGKNTQGAVMGYVKAADIINVALSDLGAGATQSIAKLSNIFKIEDKYGTYDAMLKIGSVVNVLSQNCTASKPYLVEFANRLAGVGNQAHISLQNIIGFGAVLDANAQKVEASATAIGQVLTRMYREPAKYAKVVGLDIQNFTNLLKRDANEALLKFLEALGKAGNMDVLAPMFKDMGENGARVITALATLSKHIDEVRWQQDNANKAFKEGTSVLNEYNIFNNTAQAGIDKAKKAAKEIAIELGEKLYPVMKHILTSSGMMMRFLSSLVGFIIDNHKAIISVTAAIVTYTAAAKWAVIQTKLLQAWTVVSTGAMKAWRVAQLAAAVATNLFRGNTVKAAEAMRSLNAAIAVNPFGLLVAALSVAVGWLIKAMTETSKFEKAMKEASKTAKEYTEALTKERKELDAMFGKLDACKKGTEAYAKAKDAIISKYGVYLKGLINERGEITNLAAAYDRLTWAAERSARVRSIKTARQKVEDAYTENLGENMEAMRSRLEELGMPMRELEALMSRVGSFFAGNGDFNSKEWKSIMSTVESYSKENVSWWNRVGPGGSVEKNPDWILWQMRLNSEEKDKKISNFDAMEDRKFKNLSNVDLNNLIKTLSDATQASPKNEFVITLPAASKEDANNLSWVLGAASDEVKNPFGGSDKSKTLNPASEGSSNSLLSVGSKSLDSRAIPGRDAGLGKFVGIPYANAFSVTYRLDRGNVEKLMRELIFEKSQRGSEESGVSDEPTFEPSGNYTSSTGADKKAAAEARRAAAKAKKEFREGLQAIKAQQIAADEATTAAYAAGEIDYTQFLSRKHDAEQKYFDDSISFYQTYFSKVKDAYLDDDKDYQSLLAKKQESEIQFQQKITAQRAKIIEKESKSLEKKENLDFSKILNPTFADQQSHEQRILQIKADSLRKQRDLYQKGSKEWVEINERLADSLQDQEAQLYSSIIAKMNSMKKEYLKLGVAERFRMEMDVIDMLRRDLHITSGEYDLLAKEISEKYRPDLPGAGVTKSRDQAAAERSAAKNERGRQSREIDKAVEEGLISEKEGERRKRFIDGSQFDEIISKIKGVAGSWADLCIDMADSWRQLFAGIADDADYGLGKVAAAAQNTFAMLNAGFQVAAEFAQAQSQIAVDAITKRYDEEIKLAQGNSYLVTRLEKEKETKIAQEKNKASESEYRMKIYAAVAQTAANALQGYGAGLQAGFPMALWLAPMLAGLAVAQGTAQVALITKQQQAAQSTGYSEGGFTKPGAVDEVAGVVHAGEWVASQKLLNNPVTRPVIDFLDQAQRTNTIGSLTARDTSRIISSGSAAPHEAEGKASPVVVQVPSQDSEIGKLAEVVARLSRRLDEPFVTVNTVTGDAGIKQAQDEYKRYIDNKNRYR